MTSHSLVRPRDGQELLPPPGRDVRDVEAQHEGQRDQVEEGVEVLHHHFKKAAEKIHKNVYFFRQIMQSCFKTTLTTFSHILLTKLSYPP